MSGPKEVTYYPPEPATSTFSTNDYRELREVMNILRGISGSSVRANNGTYSITYTANEYMSYSELVNRINRAREKARDNIRVVDTYIANANRDIEAMRRAATQKADKMTRQIESSIATLKELRQTAITGFKSAYLDFNCQDDVKVIDKKLEELEKAKDEVKNEKIRFEKSIKSYSNAVYNIEVADDIRSAEALKPHFSIAGAGAITSTQDIVNKVNKKLEQGKLFAAELDKVAKVIRNGELASYDKRFVDKVKTLDPFDPQSLNKIKGMMDEIINEEKALEAQKKNKQMEKDASLSAEKAFEELKKLSESLSSIITKGFDEDKMQDATEINQELLKEVQDAIGAIRNLDYLSNKHNQVIDQCLRDLEEQKNLIGSSSYSAMLQTYIDELANLKEEALKNDENYKVYVQELNNNAALVSVLSPDEKDDIKEYSAQLFNPDIAEQQIKEVKTTNKALRKAINEIQKRAHMEATIAALEKDGDRVFKKEIRGKKMSCSYIKKDTVGVIYDVEAEENGIGFYPRGVMLHNGEMMIDPEQLREVHHSCGWANDLTDVMVGAGFPAFELHERDQAACEELYNPDNYHKLESWQESYDYLKMHGWSDEQIFAKIGEKEGLTKEQDQETDDEVENTVAAAQEMEIKVDD